MGNLERYQLLTNGLLLLFHNNGNDFGLYCQIFLFFMRWFNYNGASVKCGRFFNFLAFAISLAYGIQYATAASMDARMMTLSWLNVLLNVFGMTA